MFLPNPGRLANRSRLSQIIPEYELNSPIPLNEWAVLNERKITGVFGFSPSGRLLFQNEEHNSVRVTDLFSGNHFSVNYPTSDEFLQYLSLTEYGGVLHNYHKIMSVDLDVEQRRFVGDFEAAVVEEQHCYCFTRLSGDSFAYVLWSDTEQPKIKIRWLNSATEPDQASLIECPNLNQYHPKTMALNGDFLFLFTNAPVNSIRIYSFRKTEWTLPVGGAQSLPFEQWVDFLGQVSASALADRFQTNQGPEAPLILHYATMWEYWQFIVMDGSSERCFSAIADIPSDGFTRTYAALTEFGIVTVRFHETEAKYAKYSTSLISIRKPLSLGLTCHFKLLSLGQSRKDLPESDPIPPLFGRNPYRFDAESEERKTEERRALEDLREELRLWKENDEQMEYDYDTS